MIDIFENYKSIIIDVIKEISDNDSLSIPQERLDKIVVETTKSQKHGDIATNAAMVLIKSFKEKGLFNSPQQLAQEIINNISAKKLQSNNPSIDNIEKLEIAGPGFINISVNNNEYYTIINDLLQSESYQFKDIGKGEKVNLEYASPNPTGPIHIGHTRGSIYGDVLAKLLTKSGYDVLKEYYINDAGGQITTLVKSAFLRYKELFFQAIEIPEGLYPGEYLIDIASKAKDEYGDQFINLFSIDKIADSTEPTSDDYLIFKNFIIDSMVELVISDLKYLGIEHDSYFSEKKNLHDTNKIKEAEDILTEKDLIYKGKLEIPKTAKGVGLMPEGFNQEDQLLFKSTLYGDDQDRVIRKPDNSPTYFAGDLAYIISKFERGATKFIMPLGFDHAGYVKRLTAAVEVLTDNKAQLKVILCQMVKFIKNGQPLKMSKRSGNFITAREVIDEVGADALRFIMLTRKNDTPFDFDLAKVIEQSKDNPIFYVQYAHARCCSVLRNALEEDVNLNDLQIEKKYLSLLTDQSEIEIMKKISQFPKIIEESVVKFEPHRVAFYLQELSSLFHSLWNKGVENINLKFIIKDNKDLTIARLLLINSVKMIIATGLDVFNIKALEEMR